MHSKVLSIVVKNPLAPQEAVTAEHEPGCTVNDLVPVSRFPQICRLDGRWLLRAGWGRQLRAGQVVEFYTYPQGGGGGGSDPVRAILMIAAVYVAVQFGQPWLFKAAGGTLTAAGTVATVGSLSWTAAGALAVTASSALVNVLVPVKAGNQAMAASSAAGSTTYSAALAGNQARLEQPIPDLYGRNKVFPDFAAEPYVTYERAPGSDTDDQYYHAVFCVGQGHYVFENKLIDDTSLANFADVFVKELPPGELPTTVLANVVNAEEVAGNEVAEGRYAGPVIACKPRLAAHTIGVDIGFSRGLAEYDSNGNPQNKTVTWRVEVREVNDFGAGVGPWVTLASETLTRAETKPIRLSYVYPLPPPVWANPPAPGVVYSYRPQVRLVRTSPFDDNSRVANTIEWIGLKAYLTAPAPLCATATHMEVRMRANEQLSSMSQRKFAVIVRRLIRKWHPDTGWSDPVQTRNPAWALANKWTNPDYGDGYADNRIDLMGLYRLSLLWEQRQDRFDGVFSQTYPSYEADQMIAQAGRAAVFRRNGVMTVARDQLRDMPVTAFTARNIQPGTVSIEYALSNEATPDGVIAEYWDNRAWDWYEIMCPAPGVAEPARPQRLRLFGVTGATHAEREGLYHAANSFYRRKFVSFATELEGMIPSFGSAAVFAPSLPGWGRGGDFVSYNPTTRAAVVTEPPVWRLGAQHYVSVVLRDGSLSAPILVTPGDTEFEVVLASNPPESIVTSTPDAERTRYVFGVGAAYEAVIRILGIRNTTDDQGIRAFTLNGVIEDDRVHTADTHLLPVDGQVQDPVDDGSGIDGPGSPGGGGIALIPRLDAITATWGGSSLGTGFESYGLHLVLRNNGVLELEYRTDGFVQQVIGTVTTPAGNWLLAAPWTPAETVNFQARATLLAGDVPQGAALNTALLLDTTRTWFIVAQGPYAEARTTLKIDIIEQATGIIQATAVYNLTALGYIPPESTGA